jgi:hypothetical protein
MSVTQPVIGADDTSVIMRSQSQRERRDGGRYRERRPTRRARGTRPRPHRAASPCRAPRRHRRYEQQGTSDELGSANRLIRNCRGSGALGRSVHCDTGFGTTLKRISRMDIDSPVENHHMAASANVPRCDTADETRSLTGRRREPNAHLDQYWRAPFHCRDLRRRRLERRPGRNPRSVSGGPRLALFIPKVGMINPFLPHLTASPEQSNSDHELSAPG